MKLASMLFALVIFVAAVFLSSCKPACPIQKRVGTVFSQAIVVKGHCKKPANVERDTQAFCQKMAGLCDSKMRGPIADLACPLLASYAKTVLVPIANEKAPVDWECDPSFFVSEVVDLATVGCRALPF